MSERNILAVEEKVTGQGGSTGDKVTRPSGSQLFYDTAGSRDKTLKLYPGRYLDPLNDTDSDQVMSDILGWMGARAPALDSKRIGVSQ